MSNHQYQESAYGSNYPQAHDAQQQYYYDSKAGTSNNNNSNISSTSSTSSGGAAAAASMLPRPANNDGFDERYDPNGQIDRSGVPQVFDHRDGERTPPNHDPYSFDQVNGALPDINNPNNTTGQGYYSSQPGSVRTTTPEYQEDGSYNYSASQPASPNPAHDQAGSGGNATGYPQPRPRMRPGRNGSPNSGVPTNPYSTLARQSLYSASGNAGSRSSLYGIGGMNASLTSKTLTSNGKNAINMYREAAKKTHDERIQLEYAKFLLQSAESSFQDVDVSGSLNATYTVYMPGDSHASSPNTPNGSNLSLPLGPNGANGQDDAASAEGKEALIKEGIYWIKLLQRKGNPEASFIAGTWFYEGKYGISKDESKATQLFSYAAKNHHSEAAYRVAKHFESKRSNGRAYSYYNMAAALGDAQANYRMSLVYLNGELGRKIDVKKAMIFLRRAADITENPCAEAADTLGMIYLGTYPDQEVYQAVFKDTEEAHKLLDKASNLGSASAQYQLGWLFEFAELNFPADPFASITYYRMAAEQGHAEAQMALSGWYLSGSEGVLEQNDKEAFEWCFSAAKKGLPRAEFGMGYYFEVGIGTLKDDTVARDWYELAAKHGNEEAKKRLSENAIGRSQDNSAALRRRVTQKRVNAATKKGKKGGNKEKDSCNFM